MEKHTQALITVQERDITFGPNDFAYADGIEIPQDSFVMKTPIIVKDHNSVLRPCKAYFIAVHNDKGDQQWEMVINQGKFITFVKDIPTEIDDSLVELDISMPVLQLPTGKLWTIWDMLSQDLMTAHAECKHILLENKDALRQKEEIDGKCELLTAWLFHPLNQHAPCNHGRLARNCKYCGNLRNWFRGFIKKDFPEVGCTTCFGDTPHWHCKLTGRPATAKAGTQCGHKACQRQSRKVSKGTLGEFIPKEPIHKRHRPRQNKRRKNRSES